MKLTIANKKVLDAWLNFRKYHSLSSLKGTPPEGAAYDDGTPMTNLINVAWRDNVTGEEQQIEYSLEKRND